MNRSDILAAANQCVNGDRDQQYGTPENSFRTIADLWNAYLEARDIHFKPLRAPDVAALLSLLKIARIATGRAKDDNWIDLAGYAACGGELDAGTFYTQATELAADDPRQTGGNEHPGFRALSSHRKALRLPYPPNPLYELRGSYEPCGIAR